MLYEIIQDNFMCFILCILFSVYVVNDRSFENKIKKYFLFTVFIILILIIFDDLELAKSRLPYPTMARRIYSSLGYAIRPSAALIMTGVLIRTEDTKKYRISFFIPFTINAVISFLSIYTSWIYQYDENNSFLRGPLNFVPFLTGMFYVTIIVYTSIVKLKIRKKGESAVVFMLAILSIIGTLLESLFGFVGMLTDVCAISVVLYYIYLHVMIYTMDSLTNAYTRRIFFLDIDKLRKDPVFIVSMDLNRLKEINDHKGHKKGDEALLMFSKTIMNRMPKHCNLYRMGGDEFSLICKEMTLSQVEHTMEDIEEYLNKKGYSFAYGIVTYRNGQDIDEVNNLVDQKMYAMKFLMKKEENVR